LQPAIGSSRSSERGNIRWETPDGRTIVAELPPGAIGRCGPHLQRLVLMLHFQGRMTCERIVALLNGAGVAISKRQTAPLLTAKLETFQAEDEAVLEAGPRIKMLWGWAAADLVSLVVV